MVSQIFLRLDRAARAYESDARSPLSRMADTATQEFLTRECLTSLQGKYRRAANVKEKLSMLRNIFLTCQPKKPNKLKERNKNFVTFLNMLQTATLWGGLSTVICYPWSAVTRRRKFGTGEGLNLRPVRADAAGARALQGPTRKIEKWRETNHRLIYLMD